MNTGARFGEIVNLTWDMVNLDTKTITITKTKSSRLRHIPINKALFMMLSELKLKRGEDKNVFTNPRTGKPYGSFKKGWEKMIRETGLKGLRFHDLRHTFASYAMARGGDLVALRDILGHESLSTTSRYAHAASESMRRLMECGETKDLEQEA